MPVELQLLVMVKKDRLLKEALQSLGLKTEELLLLLEVTN